MVLSSVIPRRGIMEFSASPFVGYTNKSLIFMAPFSERTQLFKIAVVDYTYCCITEIATSYTVFNVVIVDKLRSL